MMHASLEAVLAREGGRTPNDERIASLQGEMKLKQTSAPSCRLHHVVPFVIPLQIRAAKQEEK
jgi:hypothetical protein